MTRELRGGSVGALTAALAVAAHGVGGGGIPSSTSWVFLLALCVCVGVGAATVSPSAPSLPVLVGWLAAGQGLAHWALSLHLGPSDAAMTHPSMSAPMWGAHAAAVTACALLVVAAERLYGPITSVLRAPLLAPLSRPWVAVTLLPTSDVAALPNRTDLQFDISRRGPPVASF
ncbi:hypothetical protein GCM10007304_00830 [Rhodococcoides trifolii]|uniref:Uncharacterized protein n=1 Tax=Rhodococcoides trifolii TaxID=908250 RepID=A0A917FKL5_9NOCA|nr:hypothetical protein [Rhodococcus trifolii]GGF90751.1 hypothetical protein GCM10007304_00830 [Rhodococcus trifolii]